MNLKDPKSYNNSRWFDFHVSDYNNGDEIPVVLTLEELIPDAEYNVAVYLDSVLVEEEMDNEKISQIEALNILH